MPDANGGKTLTLLRQYWAAITPLLLFAGLLIFLLSDQFVQLRTAATDLYAEITKTAARVVTFLLCIVWSVMLVGCVAYLWSHRGQLLQWPGVYRFLRRAGIAHKNHLSNLITPALSNRGHVKRRVWLRLRARS